jgi:tetratricopeptide (TPR) repeat protein
MTRGAKGRGMKGSSKRRETNIAPDSPRIGMVCLFLAALTLLAFSRVLANGFFTDLDDNLYVTQNPHVYSGLSAANLRWAFETFDANNWHPLTWLSLQLDSELWGRSPLGFHATNVLLHTANVLLLFGWLWRLAGKIGRSTVVAALFAVHPLHVESVAWISERKDVLSTLFWMLGIHAYVSYVQRPDVGRYLKIVLCLALGLLSKPMLVTFPCVLFLLDYWPLGRLDRRSAGRLIVEKLPLLGLVVASALVTIEAQQWVTQSLERYSLAVRSENACLSYAQYLGMMFWPLRLAFYYPHPGSSIAVQSAVAAAFLLIAISVLAVQLAGRAPYLPVGWFWYLGTLVPVMGIVQVGGQAMADRYTYVPLIGIFIVLAWGIPDLALRYAVPLRVPAQLAIVLITACAVLTWQQVGYWKNGEAMLRHTIEVTTDNYRAHSNLGQRLIDRGKLAEARAELREALRIKPDEAFACFHMGLIDFRQGNFQSAREWFEKAIRSRPQFIEAHIELARTLMRLKDDQAGMLEFERTLAIDPLSPKAHQALATELMEEGKLEEARKHLLAVMQVSARDPRSKMMLALVDDRLGQFAEAAALYAEVTKAAPRYAAEAYYQLARVRLHENRADEAIRSAAEATRLAGDSVLYRAGLAFARARNGDAAGAEKEYADATSVSRDWPRQLAVEAWEMATNSRPGRDSAYALELAEQATQGSGGQLVEAWDARAAAQAGLGRFDEAVSSASKAAELARSRGQEKQATAIDARIALYRGHKLYGEESASPR